MNAKPISESAPMGCVGKGALALLGVVFIAGGIVGVWFITVKPALKSYSSRSWPSAQCEVVSSRIDRREGDDGPTYAPIITFQYPVDQAIHTSNTYSFSNWSGSRSSAQKVLARYPIGSKLPCYYNPADPAEAVLDRSFFWLSLFGLLFLFMPFLGYFLVTGSVTPKPRKKYTSKPDQTKLAFGENDSSEELTAEIFTPDMAGPQRLKPESNPVGSLIGTIIGLLVSCGITGGIAYHLFKDGWNGEILLTIFALIGSLISIGLLVGVVYQSLALTNPKVEIALSNGTVTPGETIDVAWETIGKVDRIRHLTLTVEAEETAEYTRGTDRVTDRETFCTIVIDSVKTPEEIQFGSKSITIPEDAVHSFSSANNNIIWRIQILGEIPRWPDVTEEFKFLVRPR